MLRTFPVFLLERATNEALVTRSAHARSLRASIDDRTIRIRRTYTVGARCTQPQPNLPGKESLFLGVRPRERKEGSRTPTGPDLFSHYVTGTSSACTRCGERERKGNSETKESFRDAFGLLSGERYLTAADMSNRQLACARREAMVYR